MQIYLFIQDPYILNDNYYGFAVGMRITGKDVLCCKLNYTEEFYSSLSRKEQLNLIKIYKTENTSKIQNEEFSISYIEYNDIFLFQVNKNVYIRQKDIEEKKNQMKNYVKIKAFDLPNMIIEQRQLSDQFWKEHILSYVQT